MDGGAFSWKEISYLKNVSEAVSVLKKYLALICKRAFLPRELFRFINNNNNNNNNNNDDDKQQLQH